MCMRDSATVGHHACATPIHAPLLYYDLFIAMFTTLIVHKGSGGYLPTPFHLCTVYKVYVLDVRSNISPTCPIGCGTN